MKTHCGLHNTTNWTSCSTHHFVNVRSRANVASDNFASDSLLCQIFDDTTRCRLVETRAPKEHKFASTALNHPFTHAATQATKAADHEVPLFWVEFGGILEWLGLDIRVFLLQVYSNLKYC
jgi:hypothetical protein